MFHMNISNITTKTGSWIKESWLRLKPRKTELRLAGKGKHAEELAEMLIITGISARVC